MDQFAENGAGSVALDHHARFAEPSTRATNTAHVKLMTNEAVEINPAGHDIAAVLIGLEGRRE